MKSLITDGTKLQGEAMPHILLGAQRLLIGRKIVAVGYASAGQLWPVIELDDGTMITASRDDEGNGPGSLFIDREDHYGEMDSEILCATSLRPVD